MKRPFPGSSWVLLAALGGACQSAADGSEPRVVAPPEELPVSVAVTGSRVQLGTARHPSPIEVEVGGFRIARFPVSLGEYRSCVEAGGCRPTDVVTRACARELGALSTHAPLDGGEALSAQVPVTCVSPERAAEFCSWVGGRLPVVEEWLLAVRGPAPAYHAWGNARATCALHPEASQHCCRRGGDCSAEARWRLGQHPAGASPSGVEDVLLARGELLAGGLDAREPRCLGERGCLATSDGAGVIGWLEGYPDREPQGLPAAAFRCVWEATP